MTASGPARRWATTAPSPTAAAVLRGTGSATMLAGGQLGNRRAHRVRLIGGGDDQRVLDADHRAPAADGGGEQRFGAAERQELLGPRAPARPARGACPRRRPG